jgi:ribosomal protein L7/L12
MKYDIFENMLNRIVALSLELERTKALAIENANRAVSLSSEKRMEVADVFTLVSAMSGDRKIDAIRAYRDLTGAGLKDAKDAVESVMHQIRLPA